MIRRPNTLVLCLVGFATTFHVCASADQATSAPSCETTEQPHARLAWWEQARLGLFIHWGLYAVPAGEWKGIEKQHSLGAEWIMYNARIPVAEYEPLAKRFNPIQFDAEDWVRMAREAGMKYIVITTKHCDGFAMYGSKVTPYNIVDATPFARDPLKELRAACDKQGMRLGFYYSHSWDWHEPDALGRDNTWDFPDRSKKDINAYLRRKSLPQVEELLTRYDPAIMWFDVPTDITPEHSRRFLDLIRRLRPDCIVNDRIGNKLGDYGTPEQFIPARGPAQAFEVCMTMNNHWGYDRSDHNWKSRQEILRNVADIAGKGGNYLLNVGPTAEGRFPPEAVQLLAELGAWMKVNGESIYGTSAGPFASLAWGRCTAKAGRLYLHVFDWPTSGRLLVPGLKTQIAKACRLADGKPVQVTRIGQIDWELTSIGPAPDPANGVIVLQIDGPPEVDQTIALLNQRGLRNTLAMTAARLRGDSIAYNPRRFKQNHDYAGSWKHPKDEVIWQFRTLEPGTFDVLVTDAADASHEGNDFTINVADQTLTVKVHITTDNLKFEETSAGTIRLPGPGIYELSVRPRTMKTGGLMNLNAVTLVAH